jgi:hypothetical protein
VSERRYRDMITAIERDTAGTGVEFDFTPTSKHIKVRLRKDGKERLVVMSASASDHRAIMNRARDVRRAVRELTGEA